MSHVSDAPWRKSSYSGDGGNNCVEVAAHGPGCVALRDSTRPARTITTGRTAFRTLISGIRANTL